MWLLAGHEARSRDLAKVAFGLAGAVTPDTAEEAYWLAATEAEAALLLGDWSTASDALARGVAVSNPDPAARATTRKQLSLVCEALSIDLVVLAPLRVPPVVHYCGHMIPPPGRIGPFAAEHEPFVAAAISVYLEESRPACAFGSLACGADILFAEALLARGVKLHVVLPFDVDRFKDVSVRQGGPSWIQRFDSCVAGASSVSFATEEGGTDQAPLFDYAARIAMGRAIIQARFLTAEVEQIAVWDGITSSALGGTGSNIDAWQQHHVRHTHVILLPDTPAVYDATIPPAEEPSPLRAMIFADIKGFSRLRDEQLRRFLDDVVRPLGKTLDRFGDDVLYRNSWGDGLYVVLRDVMAAAECAIALQDTMRSLDLEAAGLPRHLGLRIGVHAGPVVEAEDPIRHERNFYGQCVTRTARLEPRTPEGSVYVTDAFAALLALDVDDGVQCQFVGHIPAAKNYGTFPMYSLTRSG
jgi:class 3 adenylate cyclase